VTATAALLLLLLLLRLPLLLPLLLLPSLLLLLMSGLRSYTALTLLQAPTAAYCCNRLLIQTAQCQLQCI
jgi:hypothetical protein